MSDSRILRSGGATSEQSLDKTKNYKLNTSGALVEATTVGDTDIVFSGSKSSLRRLADLERNVSILAARTTTDDGAGTGYTGSVDLASKANQWTTARTVSLAGDLSGSVSINGTADVTLTASVVGSGIATKTYVDGKVSALVASAPAALDTLNELATALGNDASFATTTATSLGNRLRIDAAQSLNSTQQAQGRTNLGLATVASSGSYADLLNKPTIPTVPSTVSSFTNDSGYVTSAGARGSLSFTAGSGAYNSTTGVITIPTNTNQLSNGAGFITGYTETDTLATVTGRGATTTSALSTGALTVSGSITATGEITAYYSDSRLKTNVSKIDGALNKVMAINGYTYDSSELAESLGLPKHMDQIGLMADEVEAVLPELVTQSAIAGYKTIRYDKVVSVLVNAVKEQQAMIEELQALVKKTLH